MKIPPERLYWIDFDNGKPDCHNNATWLSYHPVEHDGSDRTLTVVEYRRVVHSMITPEPTLSSINVKEVVKNTGEII